MRGIRILLAVGFMFVVPRPTDSTPPASAPETDLANRIGQMLMVGFRGTEAPPGSFIARAVQKYRLGGVILFDFDVPSRSRPRNITGPAQVKRLIRDLQSASPVPLLVAVDAEGGKVNRLRPEDGFLEIPGARDMSGRSADEVATIYGGLAEQLAGLGFNLNLAPVVDVDLNPENPVIGGLGRSFSSDPGKVIDRARIFIEAHRGAGVITCLKHYPGHGSSRKDSHLGLVDVTDSWKKGESRPYRVLIREGLADMIMTAHIVHRGVDPRLPATLSPAHLRDRLRGDLGFRGVIISDDIQMGAVTALFGEGEAAVRAVRAGCDILAIANNGAVYDEESIARVHRALTNAVADGSLPKSRIEQALDRIGRLKRRRGIERKVPPGRSRRPGVDRTPE